MSEENKTITVREFKAMIAGMDLLGGEDWAPDSTAWKRIREKIDALVEDPDPAPTRAGLPRPPVVNSNNPWEHGEVALPPVEGVPVGPTEMGAGMSALTPPPAAPAPAIVPNPLPEGGDTAVKTPDIDSSGGYNSAFV